MTLLVQHPIAKNLTPPLTKEEVEAYEANILQNGQIDDIVLYEGMVLDGWHRYNIVAKHSLIPKFKEFQLNGVKSPGDFVIAKLHGRHMARGQQVAVATLWALENKTNPTENLIKANKKRAQGILGMHEKTEGNRKNRTTFKAASIFKVGEAAIEKCITVNRRSKKLFDLVWRGEITVEYAYKQCREKAPRAASGREKEVINNILNTKTDIIIPSCYISHEELQLFIKNMCMHGWMRESREKWDDKNKTMQYASHWYGNGYPSNNNNWSDTPWESEFKRSVVVSAKERLEGLKKRK